MEYYVKSVVPIIESNYDKFTTVERNIADFFHTEQKESGFFIKIHFRKTLRIRSVFIQICEEMRYRGYRNSSISMNEETFVEKQESITGNTRMILNAYQNF